MAGENGWEKMVGKLGGRKQRENLVGEKGRKRNGEREMAGHKRWDKLGGRKRAGEKE
jgi:hypothetical protein